MKKIITLLFIFFLVSCGNNNVEKGTEKEEFINRTLNEKVELNTMDFTVLSYKEVKETPYTKFTKEQIKARDGAKLIIAEVKAKNKKNEPFYENFSDIPLQDENGVKYKNTPCVINVENCFSRNLQPGLEETGLIIYEVPEEVKGYGILIGKASENGISEIYFIK